MARLPLALYTAAALQSLSLRANYELAVTADEAEALLAALPRLHELSLPNRPSVGAAAERMQQIRPGMSLKVG